MRLMAAMRLVAAALLLAEPVGALRAIGLGRSNDSVAFRSWQEANSKAEETVGKMETDEKVGIISGHHFLWLKMRPDWGFYVGNTREIYRLGIVGLKMQDAGQGFRPTDPHEAGTTTSWPCLLALGSTWDERLVGEVAAAIGKEFAGKGANVMLGPSVNVHRTALNGRNFEYLSGEDPYLGSRLVDDFVEGVQSQGVMATMKHFAFNEQETNRFLSNSIVDDRTAWELYYPPFEAAVKAGAGAFMCSYNKVNGTHACGNKELLLRDLKGKMGFQGIVMSDWGGTHSAEDIANGLDIEMPGMDPQIGEASARVTALKLIKKNVAEKVWEGAVRRVLSTIYRLRLDERWVCPEALCTKQRASDQATPEHAELARRAATNALTLLKNNKVLPIDPARIKKLGVVGPAAEYTSRIYAGGGSGYVPPKNVITPLTAVKRRAAESGITVVSSTKPYFTEPKHKVRFDGAFRPNPRTKTNIFNSQLMEVDAIIVFVSAGASEGSDRKSLTFDDHGDLIIQDAINTGKPTIVCMMTPGAMLTPWRNGASAIANLFLGGQETSNAWADVLFGDVPPGGKLPILFPATNDDVIKPQGGKVIYKEGLFTSYRNASIKAAFPFGHGLSYTAFSFGPPLALPVGSPSCPGVACLTLNVTNVGSRNGTEVAQAYVEFGAEAKAPARVLRGFEKTRLLQPKEKQTLLLVFKQRDLSTYDPQLQDWVLHRNVTVHIGPSSAVTKHSFRLLF